PAMAQEEAERSAFIQFVENQLSTPDQQIRLNGLRGTLSSNVSLQSITIADREGVWLTIVEPALIWDRSALLRGRLQIERLSAARIDVTRAPVPAPARPEMQARSFQIPELPIATRIGDLSVDRVTLAEPVLGVAAVFSVNGNLALEGGGVDAELAVERQDGRNGQFVLVSTYQRETNEVVLNVRGAEPAEGLLAHALGIPGRPAVAFTVAGGGPADALQVDLRFDADGRQLIVGTLNTVRQRSATQVAVDVNAQLAPLVSQRLAAFFGGSSRIVAEAQLADNGAITLNALDVSTAQSVLTGTAMVDESGMLLEADVSLGIEAPDGAPVVLPFGEATAVRSLAADIDYVHDRRQALMARVSGTELRAGDASVARVAATLEGLLRRSADTSRAIDFQLDTQVDGIVVSDPGVTNLLRDGLDVTGVGIWQEGQPLVIDRASLASTGWALSAAGRINGTRFDGELTAGIDQLRAFEPVLGFAADGRGDFSIDGVIDALTGALDITLDGASDIAGGEETLTRLFAGTTDVSGSVVRDEDGTRITDLRLQNNQIGVAADGVLAPEGSALDLDVALSDLSLVVEAGSGALSIDGTVSGTGPDYDARLNARLPNAMIGDQRIEDFVSAFDGTIGTVSAAGGITLDGLIGGQVLSGTSLITVDGQSQEMSSIDLRYAGADLSGDLRRNETGALTGALNFETRDLAPLAALAGQSARGTASGLLTLSPRADARQGAGLSMQLAGVSVGGVAVQSGNAELDVTDLFGAQQLSGTIDGRQIVASGTLSIAALRATLSGTPERLAVDTRLDDVAIGGLASANISPASLDADLVVLNRGQSVQFVRATAQNGQGLQANGSGAIAVDAGTLNLQLEGVAPLSLAQGALASRGTRLDGAAEFSLVIDGALSAPRTNGLVSIRGASLVDPLSNLEVGSVDALAGFEGERITIRQLAGRVRDNGRFTGSGSIGLTGGLPADIQIDLIEVPYSDGQTFATTVNGDLRLSGLLVSAPALSGTINLARTEIVVPEVLGAAVDLPQVNHINPSATAQETLNRIARVTPAQSSGTASSPLRLDLTINAPSQIFVRGRGLDAELGGRIRLTGPVTNVAPIGRFDLRRGRLEILSQRLDFDSGRIVLAGDLDPILNFVANTQAGDVVATVTVTGSPSDLSVIFSSAPALPQDEVIARIVFGRSVSELSPVQILRLANAVSELSGQSTSLFGATRALIGLDNLDVVDDGEGNAAVRAGTYISDRVYLGIETGQETEATINLDLTESLTARGSVSGDGESKIGVFFERDY
ncbi:MAG: translocation/assembly module TamB domain-containing protein, partial [Pseudomonadota bacterium]